MEFDAEKMWHSSTKIDYILNTLNSIWDKFRTDPESASVQYGNILIFSQWTEMLQDIGVLIRFASHIDCSEEKRNGVCAVRRVSKQRGERTGVG